MRVASAVVRGGDAAVVSLRCEFNRGETARRRSGAALHPRLPCGENRPYDDQAPGRAGSPGVTVRMEIRRTMAGAS